MHTVCVCAYTHGMTTGFLGYLREISGGATNVEIAKIAGTSHTSVGRWSKSIPSPEVVVRLARHYGRPPVETMVAAGYFTAEEASVGTVRMPLSAYPHSELLNELDRRLVQASHRSHIIESPEDYGEEPTPDDFDLAAGTVARDNDDDSH